MKRIVPVFFALLSAISLEIEARTIQPHEEIKRAVSDYLVSKSRHLPSKPEIEIQPLDRRLRLTKCASPLEVFMLPGSRSIGRISVGVRCVGGQHPWTIYSSAFVKVFENVVTLNSSLPRDTEIAANNLTLRKVELSRLRSGYLTSPQEAVGKRLKRDIQKGAPLNHRLLLTPKMVKKGGHVIILAKNSALSIRMAGKALSNGTKGELIRIKNIKSGRIVQAKVISEGVVQIPL